MLVVRPLGFNDAVTDAATDEDDGAANDELLEIMDAGSEEDNIDEGRPLRPLLLVVMARCLVVWLFGGLKYFHTLSSTDPIPATHSLIRLEDQV